MDKPDKIKVHHFSVPDGQSVNPEDIAKMLGIPVEEVPVDLLKQMEEGIQKEKKEIKFIINPFYDELMINKNENEKKILELIDAGKFIYHYDRNLRIIECSEQPDFIIELNGEKIGLEHTQLLDQTQQHRLGKMDQLLEEVEKLVFSKNNVVTGLFNILMDTEVIKIGDRDFLSLKKNELKPYAEQLANYLVSSWEKIEYPKPDFIEEIIFYPNEKLSIGIAESYLKQILNPALLEKRIDEKEKKIENYNADKGLKACWLLIVFSGKYSSSNFNFSLDSLPKDKIKFQRIFVFNSFTTEIYHGVVG